jgi:UDP-2,4-diacetamido-2,4,6-trideoxy-beta-L-altropyranose hydrolase
MKIAIRADASLLIGTGHIMRCLTLADALRARGAICIFICRGHDGHLLELIRSKGFKAHELPTAEPANPDSSGEPSVGARAVLSHAAWLGGSQSDDAQACAQILRHERPDWLLVDHYALDTRWEQAMAPFCGRIMVIDDLADRSHSCDLLLDQTLGRSAVDYHAWVPEGCKLLCGAHYAMLRPEFAGLRSYSLQRRQTPRVREVLVTMGGVDEGNVSTLALRALENTEMARECRATVVLGPTALWGHEVRQQVERSPMQARVLMDVRNMAQLMADSDLAIGAAGTTAWERCCLGLPTVVLCLAENQRKASEELERAGAALGVNFNAPSLEQDLGQALIQLSDPRQLKTMSMKAAAICDGLATEQVTQLLYG